MEKSNITIRTPYNYVQEIGERYNHKTGEIEVGVSMTVPDQSYSPKELLERFAKGLPIQQNRNMHYLGDIPDVDPRRMDLVEIDNAIQDLRKVVAEKTTELKEKEKQRRKEREEKLKAEKENDEKALYEKLKSQFEK